METNNGEQGITMTAKPRKTLADLRAAYIVRLASHDEYPDWQADAAADLVCVETETWSNGADTEPTVMETGLTTRKRYFVVGMAGRSTYRANARHTGTHGHLTTGKEIIAIDEAKRAALCRISLEPMHDQPGAIRRSA